MSQLLWLRAALLTAALAVLGCVELVEYTPVNAPPHAMPPRPPAAVQLYTSIAPARPHLDVGLIEVTRQWADAPDQATAEILSSLRAEAAARGCDAVVLLGISTRGNLKQLQATCIVYTDVAPALSSAPAPAR